jgi:hypothetical protein
MVEMSTATSPQYENAQASEVEAQNPQTADVQVRNPKQYKYSKQTCCLPSISVLHRQLGKFEITTGLNECILYLLEYKFKSLKPIQKHCTLCVDEIALKSHLFYNRKLDTIVGNKDLEHNNRQLMPARNALVFMIKSLCGGWKQSVAY